MLLSNHTLIKFILVGILNTIFGYSIFSLLIFCGLHYTLAMFLATVVGVLFNFKTFGKLVFNNSKNHLIFKFVMTYSVVYLINVSTLKLLLHYSFNVYLAGACSSMVAALFSYKLNKEFVFKEKSYEAH